MSEVAPPAQHQIRFIRNADALHYVEIFIVSAVTAILVIRAFLHLTGYPQLGGGGLHIAHMLWGGLLMLVALILLLTTLEKELRTPAAVFGGLGFGTFIDELGKFLTSDNDYFYEPTIALIYVIFILLFLSLRTWQSRTLSETENIMNAFVAMQDMVLLDFDVNEKNRAQEFLRRCDPADVRVLLLKQVLDQAATIPAPATGLYVRTRRVISNLYARLVRHTGFATALTVVFIAKSLGAVIYTLLVKFGKVGGPPPAGEGTIASVPTPHLLELAAMLASAALVIRGVLRLGSSRLATYRDFRRSLLVTICIGYVFAFYDDQFGALAGLALNLVFLAGMHYLIALEHNLREAKMAAAREAAPGAAAAAGQGVTGAG
jgi:hypothetical protein